jgi:hypothetical protein
MSYFVEVRPDDWTANQRNWQRAGSIVFGPGASPTFAGLTLSGLTASTLIGANASKALESVTIGTGLDYTRPTLSLSHLGVEALTDPGADRIFFWDDSETASKWLTVSTGLQISTTNITTKDSEIVHDNLSGFVANEHIDHTSVTLTAGTGLTGGGDISTNRTFAVDGVLEDLDTLGANSADSEFLVGTGAGALAWESGATVRTSLGLTIGTNVQAHDAGLDSLAALTVVSDSVIKATATDTYEIRTLAEIKSDLSLNLVENTALSTWAGTTNITTLGTIGTGTWQGTSISTTYTDAKCTDATADNTATNETSHADVVVDGDFTSNGLMERTGAGSYGIKVIGTDVQAFGAILDDLNTLGAPASDGQFIVATGAGALAWESGATARTSIGLGTTDTATFGKLVLNAASPNVLSVTATGDSNPVVTITGGSNTVLALINSGTVAYLKLSNSTEANNYVGSNGTGLEFWTENASRATINSAGLTLGTLELTCGSINRTTGTLTLEIGGTAEISITSTTVTLGGNLIIPDSGTIGSASDTDVMTIDASGNCTFSVFPITPSVAPDADYEVANKKYVDDNAGAGGGVVVQVVNTQTGAVSSGNTQLPCDDSVPQNTEGDEVMTLAITPTSSTNELKIEVTVALSASTADEQLAAALFQDTTASALAAVRYGAKNASEIYTTTFTHYMTAGTTSETTFKVRVGPGTAATVTFNGSGGTRRLGGAFASSITITEIST